MKLVGIFTISLIPDLKILDENVLPLRKSVDFKSYNASSKFNKGTSLI
jgi:hypothetical protein